MIRHLFFFLLVCLSAGSFVACGGSSSDGAMIIDGTLNVTVAPRSSDGQSSAKAVSGIEICCGGQCDVTDSQGAFSLATNVEASLFCTARGTFSRAAKNTVDVDDGFIIIALGAEGVYAVEVRIIVDEVTGEVRFETRTLTIAETNPNVCGNGVAEGGNGEDCDGADLSGASCRSVGFAAGDLSCNTDCTFNTSQCDSNENGFCGDGIIDSPGEQCEGSNLDGATCESLGFLAGTLACSPDCEFDTNNCTQVTEPPQCGNGVVESGEDCEGSDLRGETCESLGNAGGTLSCNADCSYNETACTQDSTPVCDDSERICSNTGSAPECLACSCDDGFLIEDCNATCFDTGSTPTICSGGVGCSDGSETVCPG